MNDERDSQLSAMFDNELTDTECELLARRISRDEGLQRQWASYALIGAALRREPVRARSLGGVIRDGKGQVAERVRSVLAAGEGRSSAVASATRSRRSVASWLRPLGGVGIAAGVAAASIFLLRAQSVDTTLASSIPNTATSAATTIVLSGTSTESPATQSIAAAVRASAGEAVSYTVPTTRKSGAPLGTAQLANFVVAHSEFSGPLTRGNLLSTLVSSDAVAFTPPVAGATESADESLATLTPTPVSSARASSNALPGHASPDIRLAPAIR